MQNDDEEWASNFEEEKRVDLSNLVNSQLYILHLRLLNESGISEIGSIENSRGK